MKVRCVLRPGGVLRLRDCASATLDSRHTAPSSTQSQLARGFNSVIVEGKHEVRRQGNALSWKARRKAQGRRASDFRADVTRDVSRVRVDLWIVELWKTLSRIPLKTGSGIGGAGPGAPKNVG